MSFRPNVAAPFIAISGVPVQARWGFWDRQAVLVAQTYVDALSAAGAQSLILSPSSGGGLDSLVSRFDGVLIPGGVDVHPELYGQEAGVLLEETSRLRDEFEHELVKTALSHDLPVLGICRGLQVMNVVTGGTLHQDLLDEGFADHRPAPGRLDEITHHEIRIDDDSHLSRCGFGGTRQVNSHHHQGVATLGRGAKVVARSSTDGLIEAVEWPAHRFAVGVQWHPEDPCLPELFCAFAAAAAASSVLESSA